MSALQLFPSVSVYAPPPECTKIGLNVLDPGRRLIVGVADFVVSAWLVAVTETVCAVVTEAGAVYSPPAVNVPT